MKKWAMILLALTLFGCSQSTEEKQPLFSESQLIPFEIAGYKEAISPVLDPMAPYIIMASTEDQLSKFLTQFDVTADIDMSTHNAAIFVSYSDSCGLVVENVYDDDNQLVVQVTTPSSLQECDETGVPHTFVLAVEKKNFEKVQLYNGNIIKASLNLIK